MKYNVTVKHNDHHDKEFGNYVDARNYIEVISHAFSIPLFLFRINDKFIGEFKMQNLLYKRKYNEDVEVSKM